MVRIHRHNKLLVLIAVVLALGLNVTYIPWPDSGFLAIAIVIPLFGSRPTLVELVAIYGVIALVGTAMMPAVSVVHKPRRAATVTTTRAASVPNGGPPPSEKPDDPDG